LAIFAPNNVAGFDVTMQHRRTQLMQINQDFQQVDSYLLKIYLCFAVWIDIPSWGIALMLLISEM
jgi:hypothetical protein